MQNRLGPDDGYGVNNAREPAIEPNEQRTVNPTQIQSAWGAMLQDSELMPQNQDFGFELRLEAVAQHANEKRPIAIMRPSYFDSLLIASQMD